MNITSAIAAAIDPGTIMRAGGLEPDSWQREALLCEDPRILINVCRQGGKSSVGGALAVHQAVFRKQRSLTLMVAPVLRQTSELFAKCRELYNAIGRPIPLKSESALKLELQNGSRVICIPADQETLQGYSADLVIFDEGARIPDPVFFALRPSVAATGGRIIGMSTPAGQQGWFSKGWLEEDYWKKFKITAHQCPRISKEFLDQERTTLGDYLYEQEYFGRFHSGSAVPGFIKGDAVRECLKLNYRFLPCPHCGVVDTCEHEPIPNRAWQSAPLTSVWTSHAARTGIRSCLRL